MNKKLSSFVKLTQVLMHITIIIPLAMSMVRMVCQIYVFHNVLFLVVKKQKQIAHTKVISSTYFTSSHIKLPYKDSAASC